MDTKDVIVIGTGISGCAIALALAKQGVSVTVLTSFLDERIYHAPFIQREKLEEKVISLQKSVSEQVSCSRATQQLISVANKSFDELLGSHYQVDRNGNVDIHRCLQEQLKEHSNVEWITHHTLIELITLHQHSTRKSDIYKIPTCIGVTVFDNQANCVERIFAKEIVMATGGAVSLFPYSTHPKTAQGEGLAIASRAGVRLLNMEQIQFYPLGLYEKGKICFPLPLELLAMGGLLSFSNHLPSEIFFTEESLSDELYEQMIKNQVDHLWLNLTMLDAAEIKEEFPAIDAFCLERGLNLARDLLPVAPTARYTCGGIAVDRCGQTNIQRLRAIGEVACTGLVYDFKDEAMGVLESLSWSLICAEDILKYLSKYHYYFPEVRDFPYNISKNEKVLEEDWRILHQVMWYYFGIKRDRQRLSRGYALLKKLQSFNSIEFSREISIDQIHLANAIQTAILIAEAAYNNIQTEERDITISDESLNLTEETPHLVRFENEQ